MKESSLLCGSICSNGDYILKTHQQTAVIIAETAATPKATGQVGATDRVPSAATAETPAVQPTIVTCFVRSEALLSSTFARSTLAFMSRRYRVKVSAMIAHRAAAHNCKKPSSLAPSPAPGKAGDNASRALASAFGAPFGLGLHALVTGFRYSCL